MISFFSALIQRGKLDNARKMKKTQKRRERALESHPLRRNENDSLDAS